MILSSADILRILGRNEVIRLSAQVSIVDGKPALSGREGIHIYINRFPVLEEFEATWRIWIESDEEDDLIIAELQRLLPRVQVVRGLMTTVSTTEFRSDNTQRAPEAPRPARAQVDLSAFEDRFQALVEDVQDQMLLVTSGRNGQDGKDGRDGADGRDGRDLVATEANLEDLQNVEQNIAKEDGQVLTWKDGVWQNLFIPQIVSSISGSGGGTTINKLDDIGDVDVPAPGDGSVLTFNTATGNWQPGNASNGNLIASASWRFDSSTAGSPASGRFSYDNATPSLVTTIYLSKTSFGGEDVSRFLLYLIKAGIKLYIQKDTDGGSAALFTATGDAVDQGAFVSVAVTHEDSAGSIVNNNSCHITLVGTGASGVEEAPQDGNYYVRQNASWVLLTDALTALNVTWS